MEKDLKNTKGITLIALVITIIILIILAGISVAALSGENGLIKRAANAKKNTEISQEKEQLEEDIYRSYNKKGLLEIETLKTKIANHLKVTFDNNSFPLEVVFTDTGNNYEINEEGSVEYIQIMDRAGIAVGDLIDYEPDVTNTTVYPHTTLDTYSGTTENTADIKQDKLSWQVLRIYKDGSMDLIGSATSQDIYFKGILGYTNGVYLMDDICKTLYSRNANGIEARSVDLEDFEYWLEQSIEGVTARDNYTIYEHKYGDSVTYTKATGFPPFYKAQTSESDTGSLTTDSSYTSDGSLTVKQTGYSGIKINSTNYGDGASALKNNKTFWVGSRYVMCWETHSRFGLRYANTSFTIENGLFFSNGTVYTRGYKLRPVVHLKSSAQITTSSNPTNTPHHITSY